MNRNKHPQREITFPSDKSLQEVLKREVRRVPNGTALVFGEEKMSFAELDRRSDILAHQLISLGIQKEDFAALYLERSFEIIVGIFAILKAGGAYVPIDVDYPKERMAFMVKDAKAKVILTQSFLKNNLPDTEAQVIELDKEEWLETSATDFPTVEPSQLAYMIYTSGSTGKPKGVMISHENVCNQLEGQQAIAPTPIDTMMLTCSISFDVSVLTIFWTLLQGGTLVMPKQGEEKDMTQLAETISRNGVTHILTLPSLFTLLLEQAPSDKLQSLRLVNVSGEVCPVSLAQRSEALLPNNQLYNLYGPTEATVNCTYFTFPKGFSEAKAPIGIPILNYEIFILDENKKEIPRGEVGEIYIGGSKPVVGRGYWNRPELTAERFIQWNEKYLYKTGDLARWQEDGNIEFLGRSDFQVKYRGFRIELGEVETAIGQHDAVKETVVLLKNEHEVNNQKLVAYVTTTPGKELNFSELRAFLEQTLPEYMLPSHLVKMENMPLTTNGKFDRKALPEPANERPDLAEPYAPPSNELEKKLTQRWEAILGVNPIGRNDKFFELGGTSIQAAKFIGGLMNDLGVSIFITTIFDYPTIEKYTDFLQKKYSEQIAQFLIGTLVSSKRKGRETQSSTSTLTAEKIKSFSKYIPIHLSENGLKSKEKPGELSPIFIIAPPRSGTTLLRVMLAGHPELFACNELQLLHFETLAERQEAYTGKFSLWSEGLIRAVMELKGLEVEEAKLLLQKFAKQGVTTREMFEHLDEWANDLPTSNEQKRISLVDKSPSYALDSMALEKAIRDFPNAKFIHLVRHPYSMVKSFEKYGMDQVLYLHPHEYTSRELGELVWLQSHRNTLEFSEKLSPQQYCRIQYEDLVQSPEEVMRGLCEQLDLPFHENLLNPYKDLENKMTDGIHSDSRSMGDTNFDKKNEIDAKKAEEWKGVEKDNFLSEDTSQLFETLSTDSCPTKEAYSEPNILNSDLFNENAKSIAIIGMSCRLPGANDIGQFWQNLIDRKDVSTEVTVSDLREEGMSGDSQQNKVNKTFAPDKPYDFDAAFFGYHPKEAELSDPQHRLFLETAYEALESAGYDPYRYSGKIGVFGGVAKNTYFQKNILTNPKRLEEAGGYQEMLASESTFSVSRVAYKLNLRGPAVNVQTACSTGGVAIHMACQSLRNGDADMVIVGGGRIQAPVKGGYEHVDGGPLSADGVLRAFDEKANGMVQGHGIAMVVLKPLEKAIADGDHIWSVIHSSAINNDGSDKTGITAPSGKGQAECIADAIQKAGLSSNQIGYFEAHGTGTFLGDPIEIQGLKEAVTLTTNPGDKNSSTDKFCHVGSVKTNIGHLDAGAAIAGIIKTSLALFHERIPGTLHFQKANPQLDLENTPFKITGENVDWKRTETPRYAGVSSFGLGGTNAHVILGEAPLVSPKSKAQTPQSAIHLFPISAKTETALDNSVERIQSFLKDNGEVNLADAAYTLSLGRPNFAKRAALVGNAKVKAPQTSISNHQFTFMFPGGGSQYVDMARDLYESNDFFRNEVNRCFEILEKEHGLNIRSVVFPELKSEDLKLTAPSVALPALLSIEISLARLWMHWGILPKEMIGHSMGEYAAAHIAGVMTLEDALGLVAVRGRLFDSLDGNGCMLSVPLSETALGKYLDDGHTISVINKPDSLVVSGTANAIERLEKKLNDNGIDCRKIQIAVPAHSPLIEPILPEFAKYLQTVDFQTPKIPFVSNVTGKWISDKEATSPEYWLRHLRQTVRFADGMATLKKHETRIFLEVGPGQTLSSFARSVPTVSNGKPTPVFASVRHPKEVRNDIEFIYRTVAKLWTGGIKINWENFHEGNRKRIPLPTYPFDHKKYFVPPSTFKPLVVPPSSPTPFFTENTDTKTQNAMGKPASRLPILVQEIKLTLEELSGLDPVEMDEEASFLELGFDSLFLSQAVIKFNYKFKTKLSFRALFEEAPTIEALAEYVDGVLPEGEYMPEPEVTIIQNQAPAQPDLPSAQNLEFLGAASAPISGDLQALFQQQLAIMQQQLAVLSGKGIQPVVQPPQPTTVKKQAVKSESQNSKPEPQTINQESKIVRSVKGVTRKANNYTIDANSMTEKQRKDLDAFIARYEEMTKTSKALAEKHTQLYADPRNVTGFSKMWKELCYQIAHDRSKGALIWDVDGNEYVDFVMSYGVALFGHMPDFVKAAVSEAMEKGNSFDLLPPDATEMARIICEITGYDRVTLANTGTEAVLGAVRAARTATGRGRIAVFDTDYHGYVDEFQVRGVHLRGKNKTLPSSPGIPDFNVENVLVLDYDDPEVMQKLEAEIDDLACVLIEPLQAQNPHWQHGDLIRKIRKLTEEKEVALIFDEVINGFRLHQRGAQGWYGVDADISAYGKTVSGGLPIAALAGKAKYMEAFDGGVWNFGDDSSPDGVITYFASTFIKNPISVASGLAAMREIQKLGPALQEGLNKKTAEFAKRIREVFLRTKAPLMIQSASSFFMIKNTDNNTMSRLFNYVLRTYGVNIRERPCFLSTAHTDEQLEKTYRAFEDAINEMMKLGWMQPYEGEDMNVIVGERNTAASLTVDGRFADGLGGGKQTEPIVVPVTEGQQEIFLSDKFSPDASKAYNIATEIRLEGKLDVEKMKGCLEALVERHEALRTTFSEDGKTQTVHPGMDIEIPVVDLRNSDVQSELAQLQDEEAEHHFNLVNGPLVRFKIIRLEDEMSLVFIHVHHIICDGWSLGILTRELGQMYGGKPLSKTKGISQYALEQAEPQTLGVFEENEKYWLDQYSDKVPVLDLPTDFSRPPVKTYNGAVEKKSFDNDLVKQIRKVAAKQGTTFYVFMLAAFEAYLSRISGEKDLVIGVAAAGHNLSGNSNLVAHAIGMLPVRSKIEEGASFSTFVKQVRGQILDAFDHQQFTFGALLKKLKLPRDISRPTMVSVAFNLDSPLDNLEFGKLKASTKAIPRHYETFDTFINLKPLNNRVDFEWNFNTDLFRPETIRLRLDEFETFLHGILEDADRPISTQHLLPDFESNQIASFGRGKKADFPLHQCLHVLFEKQVEKTPDAIAVELDDEQLTYRELSQRSNQLAQVLIENRCQTGDFVGLILEQSVEMLVGIYGILKAGAAYVPIDPRNPEERIRFTLEDAGCQLIVTERNIADELPEFEGEVIFTDDEAQGNSIKDVLNPNSQSPAYIIYTSGSTGRPKGVVVRHENAINTLFAINQMLELGEKDVVFSVSSMSFDMSIPDYFLSLICGAKLVLSGEQTKKDGFALREAVEKAQPTFMQATPTTWKILHLSGWGGSQSLKAVAGGEGFPKDLAEAMMKKCQTVWNGYGPTETTIYATWQKVTAEHLANCPGEYVAIGSPIANVEMVVFDENKKAVPIGVPGELYIGGKGVTNGYLNRKKLTAEKFIDSKLNTENSKLYRTGDLVRYLPSGEIEFLGRIDGQVKLRGYRIELGEIEEVMKQGPGVSQAAVKLFSESADNQMLVGYLVGGNGMEISTYLRSKLPGYMVPSHFVEMEELPMNTSLKVDRKALPKPDFSKLSNAEKEEATTRGEKLLTNIWEELLGVPEVSIHDDFFELGGHSLAAVQLMSRIREATGKKLPLTILFQHSTIQKLATQLNGYNSNGSGNSNGQTVDKEGYSSLITIQKGNPEKAPLYLVHGGGLHVLFYQNMVKYLDADQPIFALQAKGLNGDEKPLDRIEEMAAHYIKEILADNPKGEYCLAGYSLGGLIAWEMASRLKAKGHQVPMLALFDSVAKYEWAGNGSGGTWKKKLKKAGFNLSLLVKEPGKAFEYKSHVLKMQFQHLKGKMRTAYRNNETNEIEEGYIPYGKEVYAKSLEAYEHYELKPLDIQVDLFKAKDQMFYLHDPENYGWDQFAKQGVVKHVIDGNHLTLFDDPHGKEVAEALKKRMREVTSLFVEKN